MLRKITPSRIQLEASSICQLKCPCCPNTSRAIRPTIGSGFLKLLDFKKLLDQNPRIEEIGLSNYGEMFLNPKLLAIFQYAYERKVVLTANTGVNLNYANSTVLEGLVKYQFQSMACSIDGASNETYKQYRVNGDLQVVLENVKKINSFKNQYR